MDTVFKKWEVPVLVFLQDILFERDLSAEAGCPGAYPVKFWKPL